MRYQIGPLQNHPYEQLPKVSASGKKPVEKHFSEVLHQQDLKISKHAKQRLQERQIDIDHDHWKMISEKVNEAKQKGVTDSLVIANRAALLVSGKNNTVITAMDINEANSRIFTNINGTIVINK